MSDVDSTVIRQYGVLNTEVTPDDTLFYGIPFPGIFVCDADGRLVAKFFHDSYKKRDSAETLIDVVRGSITLDEAAPATQSSTDDVRITAAIHGGKGTIRQGVMRKLVVRFELGDGLHIYDGPCLLYTSDAADD